MRIIECEQGSPEWFKARAGVITASNFAECRKRPKTGANKGGFTDKAHKFAFKMAIERLSGELLDEDNFETWAMKRGREMEAEARLAHEEAKGILVEQAGISLTDDGRFGASVDGLIDDDGASEYKCFISPNSLMPILLNNDLSAVIDQVQGQLWVTERLWSDFVLYCPALKPINRHLTIITVQRDDNFIEELESDMLRFDNLVCEYQEKLRG